MYLNTFSYGSCAMDQRSGDGWLSGWSQIFAFCQRNSWSRLRVTRRENCFSTEQNHPEYPLQKKKVSLEEMKAHKEDRFFRGRQIAYLIYEYFRVTGANDSVENNADSGNRLKVGRNFIVDDENPTWWYLGKLVQIKKTRVWETQYRIGIVLYGDSSEESWTWLSQIEDNGKKKCRAEFENEELWGQKWKFWPQRLTREFFSWTIFRAYACEKVWTWVNTRFLYSFP